MLQNSSPLLRLLQGDNIRLLHHRFQLLLLLLFPLFLLLTRLAIPGNPLGALDLLTYTPYPVNLSNGRGTPSRGYTLRYRVMKREGFECQEAGGWLSVSGEPGGYIPIIAGGCGGGRSL